MIAVFGWSEGASRYATCYIALVGTITTRKKSIIIIDNYLEKLTIL